MGDREHIKDTQSITHRFCTNPLKPRTTFGAEQDDEHEGAFVEFQLGDVNGCWDLGVKCKTSDGWPSDIYGSIHLKFGMRPSFPQPNAHAEH